MSVIEQGGNANTNVDPSGALVVTTRTPLTALPPTAASVTGVVSTIVLANSQRKGLIIQNISQNTVSLGFGATLAVLNSGITLPPFGTFEMDEYAYGIQQVTAIASGTPTVVAIQEFI